MKKSFLKRVAAAVVAVPVALTQTALFTSFAEGETTTQAAGGKTISMDTLMEVKADAPLLSVSDFKTSSATKLTKFTADELKAENPYIQLSEWGNDAYLALTNMYGTYALPKEKLAEALKNKNGAKFDLVKNAITNKNTSAVVEVSSSKIEITIDFDYAYGQDLANMATEAMNKKIAQKYNDVNVTVVPTALKDDKLKGKIVLTADTKKILDKTVKFTSSIEVNGTKQEGAEAIEQVFADEAKKALAHLQMDAEAAVDQTIKQKEAEFKSSGTAANQTAYDHAKELKEENLPTYAADLLKQVEKYQGMVDGKKGNSGTFEIKNAKNADVVLEAANKKFSQVPASVAALESNNYYNTFVKVFDGAVNFINEQAAAKGYQVSIKSSNIMDVIKGASNISAYADVNAKVNEYKANGETLFYVTDDLTEAEKKTIINNLNNSKELLTANKKVNEDKFYTVKIVEVQGALDASTKFDGEVTVEVYRIINFESEEKETETTTTTTETQTTPTETQTTPTETQTTPTDTQTTPTETQTTPTETQTTPTDTQTTPTGTQTTPTGTQTTPTETTTTKHTKVAGEIEMNVTVKTELAAGAGFYFDNDKNEFAPSALADLPSESPEMEGAVAADKFTVGDATKNITPADLYAANKEEDAYVVKALQLYYNGLKVVDKDRKPVTMTVYVGAKGDLTQDGACNAKDANRALIHAAAVGTTKDGDPLPTISDLKEVKKPAAAVQDTFDKFLIFLGDVDTESVKGEMPKEKIAVNAKDANAMLRFAAQVGTNKKPGEEGYKNTSELWTIVLGAENLTAYSQKVAAAEVSAK